MQAALIGLNGFILKIKTEKIKVGGVGRLILMLSFNWESMCPDAEGHCSQLVFG